MTPSFLKYFVFFYNKTNNFVGVRKIEKNIINIHIYGFYLSLLILCLRICFERGGWILKFSVGLAMVERGLEGGTCGAKREAKEMNIKTRQCAELVARLGARCLAIILTL